MPSAQHIFPSGQLFELSAKSTQTNHFDSFREALRKEANLSECDVRTRSYCAFASFEPRLRTRTADGWCEQRRLPSTIFFLSAVSGVNYIQEAIDFNDGNY